MVNPFPGIFYLSAAFAVVAASMAVCIQQRTPRYAAVSSLAVPLVIAYLLGMYRSFGIDFNNYAAYLGSGRDSIPDVGYKLLMEATYALELSLSEFFLLQGMFSLIAVYVLGKKIRSDLVVTLALYILHAAIVRDFSQSRTALALAFYFFALAQDRRLFYFALTAIAISVHLTVAPLVLAYHWSRVVVRFQSGQFFFIVAPAVALVLGMELLLPMLSALDPRIEIYLNWSQDLYGSPVGSYSTLMLFMLIGAIIYRAYRVTGDETSKVFVVIVLYAAVTFIAFRQLAIFAFRLSNIVAALYPFAIGRAIFLLRGREQNRLFDVVLPLALLAGLLLAIIIRPGSFDVLEETEPALLVDKQ